MDSSAILFDIQRSDDADWLAQMREEATESVIYFEAELAVIYRRIEERLRWLAEKSMKGK